MTRQRQTRSGRRPERALGHCHKGWGLVSPCLFEVGQREDVGAGSSDTGADMSREFSKGGLAAFGAFYDRDGQPCLLGELVLPHAGMTPGGHRHRSGDGMWCTRCSKPPGHSFDHDGRVDGGHAANHPWSRSSANAGSAVITDHTRLPWRRHSWRTLSGFNPNRAPTVCAGDGSPMPCWMRYSQ
jgi:hypothetical protein